MKRGSPITILVVILLLSLSFAYADDPSVVVVNSYDWRDIFLGGMYAAQVNAEFHHFQNLADSQVKTASIGKENQILVFESNRRPVVKNYQKILSVNDYYKYDVVSFQNYAELQDILWLDEGAQRIIIFNAEFGLEALAGTPYLLNQGFVPLLLGPDNKAQIQSALRSADHSILAGYFPVRTIDGVEAEEQYLGLPDQNVQDLTRKSRESSLEEWGVLLKPDSVDMQAIATGRPIFLYVGDSDFTAEIVKESGLIRFEVIGASLADTASVIEGKSGADLKFLLKYARTFTGIEGLRGEILDIDGVFFDFQNPNLEIAGAKFYPDRNILTVQYRNNGNIGATVFANVEFAQNALQDEFSFVVPPNGEVSVPYAVQDTGPDTTRVVVSGQFGIADQLSKTIEGNGRPFVDLSATEEEEDSLAPIEIQEVSLNKDAGVLVAKINNPNGDRIRTSIALLVNNSDEPYKIYSDIERIGRDDVGVVNISVPFLTNDEILGQELFFEATYGIEDTVQQERKYLVVTEYRTFDAGLYLLIGGVVIALVVLIVLIIVVLGMLKNKPRKPAARKRKKVKRRKR